MKSFRTVINYFCAILLIVFHIFIRPSQAQNNCKIPEIDLTLWEKGMYSNDFEVEPNFVGIVKEFETENILEIDLQKSGSFYKYMNAELNGSKLVISTTEAFKNYENEQVSNQMQIFLEFTCSEGTKSLRFFQSIKSVNNFAPEFTASEYKFMIGTPLPQNFDITLFNQSLNVSAIDRDLSDYEIDFTLDGTDSFRAETVDIGDKVYKAKIVTTRTIKVLPGNKLEFNLIATDSGTPSKSTSVPIIITKDEEVEQTESPSFDRLSYSGSILGKEQFKIDQISLKASSYDDNIKLSLNGDYANHFSVSNLETTVNIELIEKLPLKLLQSNFTSLEIWAERESDTTGKAVILLAVEAPERNAPKFLNSLYHGTLDESLKLNIPEILLDSTTIMDDIKIELTFKSKAFDFYQEGRIIQLYLVEDFDKEIFQKEELEFEIIAKKGNGQSDSAHIIIKIIRDPLEFEKNFYNGVLHDNNVRIVEISNNEKIGLTREIPFDALKFSLLGDDRESFAIIEQNNRSIVEIEYIYENPINFGKKSLELIIVAENPPQRNFTVLRIELKRWDSETQKIEFKRDFYRGTIGSGMKLSFGWSEVSLKNNSIFKEVEIFALDDSNFHFIVEKQEGSIIIKFPEDAKWERVRENKLYQLTLLAKLDGWETGMANIIIEVKYPPEPKFEKNVYLGTSLDRSTTNIAPIKFLNAPVVVQYYFEGQDAKYFQSTLNENSTFSIKIQDIPSERTFIHSNLFVETKTERSESLKSISTDIVVTLPAISAEVDYIRFEQNIYHGFIDMDSKINLGTIKIAQGYSENVVLKLSEDVADVFSINQGTTNEIQINLQDESLLGSEKYFNFYIEASREGFLSGYASILLDVYQNILLKFDKNIYEGIIDKDLKLSIEEIIIPKEIAAISNINLKLVGKYKAFFELIPIKDSVKINLTSDLDERTIQSLSYISLNLIAENNVKKFAETLILIEVKHPPVTSSSDPVFEKDRYSFEIFSDFVGVFGRIVATVDNPDEDVSYSLNNDNKKISIDKNTGELKILMPLNKGRYKFEGIATNSRNDSNFSKVDIILVVLEVSSECPVPPHVENILEIKKLRENSMHKIIGSIVGNCEYEIKSVNPKNLTDLIYINRLSKYVESKPFDREDEEFFGLLIPQIQIELDFHCSLTIPSRSKRDVNWDPLIMTKEIPYTTNKTFINIIIEDENDNAPVFIAPSSNYHVIGYPEGNLLEQVLPPYLIVVEATDKDEGLNALIKYTINPNPHFGIDPINGVIYPLVNCFKDADEVNLTVTATDRDGASDGLSSYVTIIVKKITKDHLVYLTIKNQNLRNIDKIIYDMRDESKLNLMVINYAPVPEVNENPGKILLPANEPSGNQQTNIRLFVYALNDAHNFIPKQEILMNDNLAGTYPMKSFEDVQDVIVANHELPWIVSTIVLSTLIILFIIVLVYFYIRQKKIIQQLSADQRQLRDDFGKSPGPSSPPVLAAKSNVGPFIIPRLKTNENANDFSHLTKHLEKVIDGKPKETSDIEQAESATGDKRKTNVTFNDFVEKIEVQDGNATKKTSYDQRL